jgi:hypothetical protein
MLMPGRHDMSIAQTTVVGVTGLNQRGELCRRRPDRIVIDAAILLLVYLRVVSRRAAR